jgi:hypothetical protein
MNQVNNLVDFFEGNALWSEKEGEEIDYVVTIKDLAGSEQVFEELYKRATIMALQQPPADDGKGPAAAAQAARRKKVQTHLAGILGFSGDKKKGMLNEMGQNAYSSFVSDRLKQTGEVRQK